MQKQLFLSTLLLSMIGGGVSAQTVSEQDAAAKAMSFFNQGPRKAPGQAAVTESQLELSYKSEKNGETYYYIFNDTQSGAFVIVAGDERATEILGYGDKGCIDFEQAPDNFKWWMSQYEAQIHAAIQQDYKPAKKAPVRKAAGRTDVPELIQTKWNQSEPYNNKVPSLGAGYTGDYALATGCVATAMAQVMNKHQWPKATGNGSKSYQGINGLTFSADFGNTTYDWENMLDRYQSGNYSQAEADAVATLMYHCGVSVDMDYDQIVNGGSGASSSKIPAALSTYFGYDKSAQWVQRDYYTDDEWTDLVYSELKAGRPLLYGGQNAYGKSGHEFVCHGYRASDNTFAINWGWGGAQDGYFTLIGVDGLQPHGSGIGGAGEGASYTNDQDIIINVMPDKGTTETPLIAYCNTNKGRTVELVDKSGQSLTSTDFDLSMPEQTLTVSFWPWNYSGDTRTIETSVMFRDVASGASFYAENKSNGKTLDHTSLYKEYIEISSSEFEVNGIYEVLPVVREQGETEWQRLRFPTSVETPTIEVINGQSAEKKDITFEISGTTVEERSTLTITHDELYNGEITYSASPAGIVSIDEDGVVTAVKVGTATITVTGEESVYFFKTTKTFEVTVTPYVKKDVEFSIDDNNVVIGKTLQISCDTEGYDGEISYSSSDNSIATVDANGTVTAIAIGKVTITATAKGNDLYNPASKSFDIQVTDAVFVMTEFSMPNNGYYVYDDVSFTATFKNNTEFNYSSYYIYCKAEIGGLTSTMGKGYQPWYSGMSYPITFNLETENQLQYLYDQIGRPCYITFLDNSKNPLSERITFYPCNPLTVTYTMSAAGWGTLCLPFEAEVPTGLTAYKVTGTTGKYLIKEEVDYLEMNTPYLLSGEADTYTFDGPDTPVGTEWKSGVMVGNTQASSAEAPVYAPKGSYVLQVKDGKLGFYEVENDNSQRIRQYSAYIQLSAGSNSSFYAVDVTDGIEQIEAAESNGVSYRINGMRLNGQAKGLSVKNGRIMFNK